MILVIEYTIISQMCPFEFIDKDVYGWLSGLRQWLFWHSAHSYSTVASFEVWRKL